MAVSVNRGERKNCTYPQLTHKVCAQIARDASFRSPDLKGKGTWHDLCTQPLRLAISSTRVSAREPRRRAIDGRLKTSSWPEVWRQTSRSFRRQYTEGARN